VDASRLDGIRLFSGLSKKDLGRLAQHMDELTVREGEELATEGRFAHEFFVIEEGTADVLKDGERIAELGPGDFFGEIGLLETERRTATVRASSAMEVIVMFGPDFKRMEREQPAVADRIRSAIRARLDD
jgi:cAMP-dependent protein kinase regulator